MTIIEMLEQSAVLTALGMAVVFAFLWLMIVCINAMAWLVRKMGWDKDAQPPSTPATQKKPETEITAAITAAITGYRKKKEGSHE